MWQCPSELLKCSDQIPGYGAAPGQYFAHYAYNAWYLGGGINPRADAPGEKIVFPPAKAGKISRPSYTVLGAEAWPTLDKFAPPSSRGVGYGCNEEGWGGDRTANEYLIFGRYDKFTRWRHNGGMNILFCDGHLRWHKKGDADLLNPDDRMWRGS